MGGKGSKKKKENVENLKNMYVKHEVDRPSITVNEKKYTIVEKIGQGGFGVVYKATYKGNEYAIKQVQIDASNAESIVNELKFIAQISSGMDPKFLPLIRVFGIEVISTSVFMVMELALCDLENLMEYTKSKDGLNKKFVDVVFAFLIKALVFLYENDTIHGDIKFQNFVVLEDDSHSLEFNIKLIDFGTINKLEKNVSKLHNDSIAGTLLYLAPEQANSTVHKKTDIWALGVMLYYMVFSDYPEYVEDEKSIVAFLMSPKDLNVPRPPPEFEPYRKIIQMCLIKETSKRASANDLLSILPTIMDASIIEQVIGKSVKAYQSPEVTTYMQTKRYQLTKKPGIRRPEAPISEAARSEASRIEASRAIASRIEASRPMASRIEAPRLAAAAPSKQCRICDKSLPSSHQYNRCDDCFKNRNKKCVICGKVLFNFRFRRCNDCFEKTRHLDKRH